MRKPPKAAKRRPGRPRTVGDGEQVSVRLDQATLGLIEKVLERARYGTKAQVLRDAIEIGLTEILRSQEQR